MEFNLTLNSPREPSSTTDDGTRFHSLMDLVKMECWYVSFLALVCPSLWFPIVLKSLLCNSWLVQQQMVDLVAHYKGLFPSSLLEGFPLKTVL
jgi:hypothetical protein